MEADIVETTITSFSTLVAQYSFSQDSQLQDPDEELIEPSPSSQTVSNTTICPACQKINFPKIHTIQPPILRRRAAWPSLQIASLGNRIIASPSSSKMPVSHNSHPPCPVCQMLHTLSKFNRLETRRPTAGTDWQLRVCSFLEIYPWVNYIKYRIQLRDYDIHCLIVTMDGKYVKPYKLQRGSFWFCVPSSPSLTNSLSSSLVAPMSSSLVIPTIIGPRVDFSAVRTWINFCRSEHRTACSTLTQAPRGMLLIDCSAPQSSTTPLHIIPAPKNAPYVALSYVWGTSIHADSVSKVSATICDAILATKELGYRYLWVDKHCISQLNPLEKHAQIMNMDAIYSSACITLVASAGTDSNAGLPGVGDTPRIPQTVIHLPVDTCHDSTSHTGWCPQCRPQQGGMSLMSTMGSPHEEISRSKYTTRGWTLQESVLSRRIVAFTESQVYYECNMLHCQESLPMNLDLQRSSRDIQSMQKPGVFSLLGDRDLTLSGTARNATDRLEENLGNLIRLLGDFSRRELTKDDDSLNAFSGIMTHFGKIHNIGGGSKSWPLSIDAALLDVMGIPFVPTLLNQTPLNTPSELFVLGLQWYHTWTAESKAPFPRRRVFETQRTPSWSWAAWCGAVAFLEQESYVASSSFLYCADPVWELDDGRVLSPVQASRLVDHSYKLQCHVLRLSTRVLQPVYVGAQEFGAGLMMTVRCRTEELQGYLYLSVPFESVDLMHVLTDQRYQLLVLSIADNSLTALLVEKDGESTKRIGLTRLKLTAPTDRLIMNSDAIRKQRWLSFLDQDTEEQTVRIS